jgi:hypothetical protein
MPFNPIVGTSRMASPLIRKPIAIHETYAERLFVAHNGSSRTVEVLWRGWGVFNGVGHSD